MNTYGDKELADTLADGMRDAYLFTSELGWLAREGAVWVEVPESDLLRNVSERLVEYAGELKRSGDTAYGAQALLSKTARAAAVLQQLRGVLREPVQVFDADPYTLNTPNWVVDLRTGQCRKHTSEDRFRKVTGCRYLPGEVDGSRWARALEAVDAEVRVWLQLRYGRALVGDQGPDTIVPFFKNAGAGAKSTLTDGVTGALGGYAVQVSPAMLDGSTGGSAEYYFADLLGARLAYIEELPDVHLNIGAIKRLSGTANITARRIRMAPVTFQSTANLFITTNHTARLNSHGEAVTRRLAEVPFPYKFVDSPVRANERKKDPSLKAFLSTEEGWETVLPWLVAGCIHALNHPEQYTALPASVRAASAAWFEETDTVGAWSQLNLVPDEGAAVAWRDLVQSYNSFAEGVGVSNRAAASLREALRDGTGWGDLIEPGEWNVKRRVRLKFQRSEDAASAQWCVVGLRLRREDDPLSAATGEESKEVRA